MLCRSFPRGMLIGYEVRVSKPVITASYIAKPEICFANAGSASRIAAIA